MRIGSVDLPVELVEGHRAGSLVIFVGAGASRDAPSSLPDFARLTAEIGADAQEQPSEHDLNEPDRFLGRLADEEVDVHQIVATRIGLPSSEPNRLHKALSALSIAGSSTRIVTTNYDTHMSAALHEQDTYPDEYVAPALPMGDDFTGIVYLHGRLGGDPQRLVVTDRDFGRAYLRDAWASRFLERMFATFTVLFVGYSHGDVVMRYLARALGPGASRYILTSRPKESTWRALGITPIAYPVDDNSHVALVDAVERWASNASMGLLEHRQQIATLVSGSPPQEPEDASYLEMVLSDPNQIRLFVEFARGEEWLLWATKQTEFQRLFSPHEAPTDNTPVLSQWFAQHYVGTQEFTTLALRVVRDSGGHIGAPLWSEIGQRLHIIGSPRPDWLTPWIVLLVQETPSHANMPWLEYALLASQMPQDRSSALMLFDYLTEPLVETQQSFGGLFGATQFDIKLRASGHELDEAWSNIFGPNLPTDASTLLGIAERNLRRGYHVLVSAGSASTDHDIFSTHRSAIEPHPQDEHRESIDALIDTARDTLEALLASRHPMAITYLDSWADSEIPIFRRLALHGWILRSDLDDTAKITWLRERCLLYSYESRHEVFRLIATSLSQASPVVADALVEDVLAGPEEQDLELRAYQQFNLLSWIVRHAPSLESAHDSLARVREENPTFAEREYPDLNAWHSVGFGDSNPPMAAGSLHERITANAFEATQALCQYQDTHHPLDGPTWSSTLRVLSETVQNHPLDGLNVLRAVDIDDCSDVVSSVISGWATATTDAVSVEAILQELLTLDLSAITNEITQFLANGGQSNRHPTEWHNFLLARQLATYVWSTLSSVQESVETDDWLHTAINNPAGRLAEFWVHAVAADWKAAGDSWTGLSQQTRTHLEMMLDSNDERSAMVEVVFASQLLFWFRADIEWCKRRILPLLDWSSPTRAQRAWHGYLTWGRWNDELLAEGLLDGYLGAASYVSSFSEHHERQFVAHLAGVALSSALDTRSWLHKFTVGFGIDYRVGFISQVSWMLTRLSAEAVEQQWQSWIRPYWEDRLSSTPRQLTFDEASAMAAWVVPLTDSVTIGVDLAVSRPAAIGEHASLLWQLKGERVQQAPAEYARLVAHLLKSTQPPAWGCCHSLATLVPNLRNQADPRDVDTIIEQALRLGCSDAPQWRGDAGDRTGD